MVKKILFFGGICVVVLVCFWNRAWFAIWVISQGYLVHRLLKALSSNFLFWHSHYESNRSIAGFLIRFDLSFLWTYPAEAPSDDPRENYCWQKQNLDRSVSFLHSWVMDGYTVSGFFLELLYQQARLGDWLRGDLFLWFFEKLALLICELPKTFDFKRLPFKVLSAHRA